MPGMCSGTFGVACESNTGVNNPVDNSQEKNNVRCLC